jgi:hypothetical protein
MRIKPNTLRSNQGGFRAGTGAVVKDRNVLGRNHRRPDANITDFLEATIKLCKVGAFLQEKYGFRPNDYGIEPFPCWRRSPRYWLRINAAMENQKC